MEFKPVGVDLMVHDFEQQILIFWRWKSKIKGLAGRAPSGASRGRSSLAFSSFWWPQTFLDCDSVTPVSASTLTWPSSLGACAQTADSPHTDTITWD